MLSRCFHFGFLKFLFPVCFFWVFLLSGSIEIQCFTTRKQILKKKIMMNVCVGSFSLLQLSRCFHGVKKGLYVAINIIAQNFKDGSVEFSWGL